MTMSTLLSGLAGSSRQRQQQVAAIVLAMVTMVAGHYLITTTTRKKQPNQSGDEEDSKNSKRMNKSSNKPATTWWSTWSRNGSASSNTKTCQNQSATSLSSSFDDDYYLQQAHKLRLALPPPRQSKFRVVALVVLVAQEHGHEEEEASTSTRTPKKKKQIIVIPGTNDEPGPYIGGAICAERAAFLQVRLFLQQQQQQQQQQQEERNRPQEKEQSTTSSSSTATPTFWFCPRIYIVTDAMVPIPPGMLCREYMYGFVWNQNNNNNLIKHNDSNNSNTTTTATTPRPLTSHSAYYYNLLSPDGTVFCLQSSDTSTTPWKVTLRELYPHPPPNMGQSLPVLSLSSLLLQDEHVATTPRMMTKKITGGNENDYDDHHVLLWKRQLQDLWATQEIHHHHHHGQQEEEDHGTSHPGDKLGPKKVIAEYDPNNWSWWDRLLQAAQDAAKRDDRDSVHFRRHGAAVAVLWKHCGNDSAKTNGNHIHDVHDIGTNDNDITILTASQCKALEYGVTMDAVSQLVPRILELVASSRQEPNENIHNNKQNEAPSGRVGALVLALVQVDQDGIPHAPYAAARSLLVEHGLGQVPVVVTTKESTLSSLSPSKQEQVQKQKQQQSNESSSTLSSKSPWTVQVVPAKELAPFVPEW